MIWSLNELEATARKAARGAGMDWGLAEEAGRATRWLCAAGWPGAEVLAGLLERQDGKAWTEICPDVTAEDWHGSDGPLCPVAVGAALCDLARDVGKGVRIGPVSHPLMLVPFMAAMVEMTGAPLAISWDGVHIARAPGETRVQITSAAQLSAERADSIHIQPVDNLEGEKITRAWRANMTQDAADVLTRFAHRTYAPETDQSRLSGAGAGLSDND